MAGKRIPALHPAGVLLGAVLTGFGLLLAETFLGPLVSRSMEPPEERILGMVHQRLIRSYVEEKDPEWLMQRGVQGMVESLDDPYTFFVGPEDLTHLDEESSGKLIGIGARLTPEGPRVVWPEPGGPAEEAGLLPGDRIVAVDGIPTEDLPFPELVAKIKGPRGSRVRLRIARTSPSDAGVGGPEGTEAAQEEREVIVERAPVPLGTVDKIQMLDPEAGIARIHIRSFAHTTPSELDRALQHLQARGLHALLLDLRDDTGGVLDAAVEVAARFLDGGLVCRLEERDGPGEERRADPRHSRVPELPVAILMNPLTASGSEVLAGALRDRGHAVLIGERSYGKGVYQQVLRFRSGHFAFKFTAGYYLTPSGRILEGHLDPQRARGLEPDLPIVVDSATRTALHRYLSWREPPAAYRDRVERLFPAQMIAPPPDPVLAAGLAHRRRGLATP